MARFEHDNMGRGPKDIRAYLLGDLLVVVSRGLHHDISTITGEEVVIFTLAEAPTVREAKR